MTKHGLSVIERAELKTIRPDGEGGCWIWTGRVSPKGYAQLHHQRKMVWLHRHVYQVINDVVLSPDVLVRHSCDNPPCWNPSHLLIGSVQDNSDDMTSRGRSNKGSQRPAAKLSEELIPKIRAEYAAGGVTQGQLAAVYGVNRSNISRAIHGQQWKHTDTVCDTDAV